MISVIIPTNERPEFLREALESVARQSAVKSIARIIISDNGGASMKDMRIMSNLLGDFSGMPIDYRKQPPCPAHEHGNLIRSYYFSGPTTKYTAILHDDDWWHPGHLATALHALESTPSATFYGSCHFDVRGPNSMLYCSHNFHAWFAANFASLNCAWVIPPENALLSCIFGCISHYSTMLMRTDAFKESSYVYYEPDANFDNDVRLQFALSRLGQVVYNPMPMSFIRHHEARDCVVNFTDDERVRHRRLTTEWIVKKSGLSIKAILDKFGAHFDACPPLFNYNAVEQMNAAWAIPELRRLLKKNGESCESDLPQMDRMVKISL